MIRMMEARIMRYAGHVVCMWDKMDEYRVSARNPKEKKPLGRRRRRWNNIKMNCQRNSLGCMDWINLTQDMDQWWALWKTVMNFRVP
jgi:hypothetical protein